MNIMHFNNNQGDMVTFLCSYDFWFHIIKGTKMQHLCLRLLIQYIVKGPEPLFYIVFEDPWSNSQQLVDLEATRNGVHIILEEKS